MPEGINMEESISNMRWLVFDAEGNFVRELDMTKNHRQLFKQEEMPDGQYTVVNITNASGRTLFDNIETLEDLKIWADTQQPGGWYSNVDCLFWQMENFTLAEGRSEQVTLPLANIHCHLHVHVSWQGLPRQSGNWTMRLYDVNVNYYIGRYGVTIGGLRHPELGKKTGEHRISVEPFNFELDGEFVVYRWTDSHVPRLQIWCNDEEASPMIPLADVFEDWHWSPDHTLSQDYWLNVVINNDGSADISVGGRGRIADWVDGGTLGN